MVARRLTLADEHMPMVARRLTLADGTPDVL